MSKVTGNKVVPKLRFKEFDNIKGINTYKRYSFKDIFNFSSGKNIKQNEASPEFKTPCVRYGELYDMYGEVIYNIINNTNLPESELLLSKGDEILLPSAGEEPLGIGSASALPFENIAIGRTINILRPKDKEIYSQFYTSYYINEKLKKEIARLAKGVSISNVYNSDLKKLKIILPNLEEQKKVASFLSAVDEKLKQLTNKKELLEDYKKGIMQKIFSQEIRFKDDSGSEYPDWQEKKLGQVCSVVKGKQLNKSELTKSGLYPALNGGINPSGYTSKWNTEKNVITISEGGNSCGYVNLSKTKFWCGGHCYALLEINDNTNFKYLFQILKFLENKIMRLRVGSTLPNIQMKEINRFLVFIPNLEEQVMIANVLSSIDKKIEFVSHQLEKNKEFKKGLLQQMFV